MNAASKRRWMPMCNLLVAALRALLLLSLVLCLPQQPVQAQTSDLPAAPAGETGLQAHEPENGVDTLTPDRPDYCDPASAAPLPGKTARVVGDDEIMVSYILTDDWTMREKVLNDVNGTLTGVFDRVYDDTNFPGLSHSSWPSAAASDLNADHKAELVVGLKNAWDNISAIVDSISSTPATGSDWLKNDDRNSGGWVWDVSAAAGNLDSSADGIDEIVLAYRDDAADYHVIGLDGNSAGTAIANARNKQSIEYWEDHSPGNERGDIQYMSVATGDLNGDGFDNEIVTAFKDAGQDLQVVVLRPNWPAGTASIIMYWDSWAYLPKIDTVAGEYGTSFRRPIDVTTGDIDGDMKDEIVVAAEYYPGDWNHYVPETVKLLAFDLLPEDPTTHTLTWAVSPIVNTDVVLNPDVVFSWRTDASSAPSVSVSAADLDGDGYDEIALGYTLDWFRDDSCAAWHSLQQRLVTYDYFAANTPDWRKNATCSAAPGRACLVSRSGSWKTVAWTPPHGTSDSGCLNCVQAEVQVATGDADADGFYEISLARVDPVDGDLEVRVFDADSGLTQQGATLSIDSSADYTQDFSIAMGDRDGDSIWGAYTGVCSPKSAAYVQAVLRAPPFWPAGYGTNGCSNDYRTYAAFGQHTDQEQGVDVSLVGTIGMSASSEKTFKGINASFGKSWERSVFTSQEAITTTVQAVKTATVPPISGGSNYETVLLTQTTEWCYNYNVLDASGVSQFLPVCIPRPALTSSTDKQIAWWWQTGPSTYVDTWVPVGANLALGGTALQSSQDPAFPADPGRAIDGKIDGLYGNRSVAHTNTGAAPNTSYWELDLAGVQWIDGLQIWARADAGFTDRLKNFYVFASDKPFTSTNVSTVVNSGVWKQFVAGSAGRPSVIPVQKYARYVRVQLYGPNPAPVPPIDNNYLDLAELEVYGRPGTPDQWPMAITPGSSPLPASSFTITWRDGRTQTLERPLNLLWAGDPFITARGSDDVGFLTGVGTDRQAVTGSGNSKDWTVGFEIKKKREPSVGTSQKQSVSNAWGSGVEFEGKAQGMGANAPTTLNYQWKPYVWQQQVVPEVGGRQEFLVLDYVVPSANAITPVATPDLCPGTIEMAQGSALDAAPQAPVITSPTHPDENTWYTGNTVTFNWQQPPGDPATVMTYDYVLDRQADTVPLGFHLGITPTVTYEGLNDGAWHLHVRPIGDQEALGATGHRKVQVDAQPPQVSLALDPPAATGRADWYTTPVTVTVSATDPLGSGVARIEVSTDGVTWASYAAPWVFSADTPGTTVYARAADAVGHVSGPVSTRFKIDRTPPDSHVNGGDGPGAWVSRVLTNTVGNPVLVLAGAIADAGSGQAGMVLEQEGFYWNASGELGSWHPIPDRPEIEVSWYYTATRELGAGYHIIKGRAVDAAGNQETPYEIGTVLWRPKEAPDIRGSSLAAAQTTARPGDEVTFAVTARNAGLQDALVSATVTLPAGLTPVCDTPPGAIPSSMTCDAAARTVTWPARMLWPGQALPRAFSARVDDGLEAKRLEAAVTFHAFWPNTGQLPPAEQQEFLSREKTVTAKAGLTIDPALPANADVTAPWVIFRRPDVQLIEGADVALSILASGDAAGMYLREWAPDPITGAWTVRQNSGWLPYSADHTWTLSAGQGVKYLGVWVADAAGNVSTLNEFSLVFVNRADASQVLADGQRVQYRGLLAGDEMVYGALKTLSGDPDAFIWTPRNAFWPDRSTMNTVPPGEVEEFANEFAAEPGRYLLEVRAAGASEYELSLAATGANAAARRRAAASDGAAEKLRPQHPLVVSDPLSAGQAGTPADLPFKTYLPLILKEG